MFPVLLLVLAGAPEPVKLASPGFTGFNVGADVLQFYSDHLAQQLTAQGVRVTTPAEIATLLGLERQKQLMGCQEDSQSCIAELANALGVDGVVTGSIGRFGESFQINLKVLVANDARPLGLYSERASGEQVLLDRLQWRRARWPSRSRRSWGARRRFRSPFRKGWWFHHGRPARSGRWHRPSEVPHSPELPACSSPCPSRAGRSCMPGPPATGS